MRRAVLVYNPKSGRQSSRRWVLPVLGELRAAGFEVEPIPTRGPGDATRLARQAAGGGCEVVFAMGGDGTLRETAAGLLGTGVALGPLPAGTANVLSLAFGLPRHARAAARILPRCLPQEIDVGLAGEVPFLMMASCGFDAEVMVHQSSWLKKVLGPGAVIASALRRLLTYSFPQIEIRRDGMTERASFVTVSNIPYYGGRFLMARGADFRDRLLDLVTFRGTGALATLGFTRDVIAGRHLERPDVDKTTVREVEILGPPGIPVQVDGDVIPASPPLTVALAEERLRVLLP